MSRPPLTPPAHEAGRASPTIVFERQRQNNQSLARGLNLLRAFGPGVTTLSNSELAERVGLPRSTVSRLTQTLVEERFLDYLPEAGVYRLGPPLLSLGLAMQQSSEVFQVASTLMRGVAEGRRINVGLAVRDGFDMVYLTSIRKSRSEVFRHVTAGSRIPIALTSLGRAYLSTLEPQELNAMLRLLQTKYPAQWPARKREILDAVGHCQAHGYCSATWQTGLLSVAAPLRRYPGHAANLSVLIGANSTQELASELAIALRELTRKIDRAAVSDTA